MRRDRREYQRAYQNGWAKERREAWLKANGPCRSCGSSDRLEVDHIDPAQKIDHRVWSWSTDRRELELKKCQPLCYRCHKQKTAAFNSARQKGRRGQPIKLDELTVLSIYREARSGGSPRAIGRTYGICHSTVIGIRDGEFWAWLTRSQPAEQLDLFGGAA